MNAAILARIGVAVVAIALAWVLLRLDGHGARRLTSANLMSVVAAAMAVALGGVMALTG